MTGSQKYVPPKVKPASSVEIDRFRRLASTWRDATAVSSSMTDIVANSAYQQIIGMGPMALPLILVELRDRPAWWFWAMAAIARVDPAAAAANFDQARRLWLDWGAANGLMPRH